MGKIDERINIKYAKTYLNKSNNQHIFKSLVYGYDILFVC